MARNDTSYEFHFYKLHKSQRQGKQRYQGYEVYTQDPNLCVAKTLDEYISCTEGQRCAEKCSQLLLSFVNPHKPVVSSTISEWLKNVLRKAGIDIGTFNAHSATSAFTSMADLSGGLIEEISIRGCWS